MGDATVERHEWGTLQWLASAAKGNAAEVTVGRVVIDVGAANPRHVHDRCEEVLYLLAGSLRHSLDDEVVELSPGDVLVAAPGVAHHAENVGQVPAEMVVVYSTGTRDFRLVDDGRVT